MPLWRPVRGPIRWPSCWRWGSPPCSAGGGSSPLLGTDWIAVKAATAWCLTVLATRSASESCSPATSRNLRHCRRGRSCQSWPTVVFTSAQSGASTGCSMPTAKCTAAGGPVRPSSPVRCRGWRPGDPMRCGAGTSPTCPPASVASGCTSLGHRRLEPQSGGLGCGRSGGGADRR